jgi:hypothetical protein
MGKKKNHSLCPLCLCGENNQTKWVNCKIEVVKMNTTDILEIIKTLSTKKTDNMYLNDFLLTWDKSDDEIAATFLTAEILKSMRQNNISSRVFDSGLAVSIFRDQSTRTRFSFASACNLLGLAIQDLDEEKSQIAHGETVRSVSVTTCTWGPATLI